MKRTLAVLAAAGLMVGLPTLPAEAGNSKHAICHYTASGKYVFQSVSWQAINDQGHREHERDIIPPFEFNDELIFEGQRWDEWGMAVFNNGCKLDDLPEVGASENMILALGGGAVALLGGVVLMHRRKQGS
jgi:LPXTG-motif cell wall-anchored protein